MIVKSLYDALMIAMWMGATAVSKEEIQELYDEELFTDKEPRWDFEFSKANFCYCKTTEIIEYLNSPEGQEAIFETIKWQPPFNKLEHPPFSDPLPNEKIKYMGSQKLFL